MRVWPAREDRNRQGGGGVGAEKGLHGGAGSSVPFWNMIASWNC